MQENTSPEERLLRLIRQDARKQTAKGGRKPGRKISLSRIFNLAKIAEYLSFNQINRTLLAILFILAIYLLVDFLFFSSGRIEERILALKDVKGQALEVADKTVLRPEPVSYYVEAVKPRNLFTAAGPEAGQRPTSPTFREMLAKLRLQGIVSGPNPQAIIEDTKTKEVYFLSPGERIGEIELKAILPGKVKLNYYGQEAELVL